MGAPAGTGSDLLTVSPAILPPNRTMSCCFSCWRNLEISWDCSHISFRPLQPTFCEAPGALRQIYPIPRDFGSWVTFMCQVPSSASPEVSSKNHPVGTVIPLFSVVPDTKLVRCAPKPSQNVLGFSRRFASLPYKQHEIPTLRRPFSVSASPLFLHTLQTSLKPLCVLFP